MECEDDSEFCTDTNSDYQNTCNKRCYECSKSVECFQRDPDLPFCDNNGNLSFLCQLKLGVCKMKQPALNVGRMLTALLRQGFAWMASARLATRQRTVGGILAVATWEFASKKHKKMIEILVQSSKTAKHLEWPNAIQQTNTALLAILMRIALTF